MKGFIFLGITLFLLNQAFSQPTLTQEEKNNLRLLQEKVYVQTDKPYYFPRETMWLKAYVQNFYPALKDSLSKLLYVELIASDHSIVELLNLKIEGGVATGSIKLPESIKPGEYVLRAYTNWMRNYGDSYIFYKPIAVFNYSENIDPADDPKKIYAQPYNIEIKTNKAKYSTREKVLAEIAIRDKQGSLVPAKLSVSVTDAEVVIPLKDDRNITDGALAFNSDMDDVQLLYLIERGITVRGRILFNKIRPLNVNIIQGDGSLMTVESTNDGYFAVTDLNFFDSLSFAFQAVNEAGKRVGKIRIIDGDKPPVVHAFNERNFTKRSMNMIQRIQNTYTTDSTSRILDEVVILGKRSVTDSIVQARMKLYNKADYTVKGNQLTNIGGNILLSLQGKVPGVRVQEYYDQFSIARVRVTIRGLSSFSGNTEPIYLVDGVIFNDANSLVALSPDLIDRVEVVTRAVPQYGSRGTNGVIAFYTKSGMGNADFVDPNFERFWITGFHRPSSFPMPNYDIGVDLDHDFRSTIYWNPHLNLTSDKPLGFSFFTADLPGRYRIVIEGMTARNIPIHYEQFIEVE